MTVTTGSTTGVNMHPVAAQFGALRASLNATYLERNEATFAILLAILAGEHVFLLGPPGTAKSQLVRAIVRCIVNARYFEIGLSKTRPVEAVLGPLDIKEFRENGNYFLKRRGYASLVEFFFADEIGKMSPILGHDLLFLANERGYHEVNGGVSAHPSPLSTMFAASNEEMTGESDDAAALWDRLLVRTSVDYLQDSDNFAALLTGDMVDPDQQIEWDELRTVITEVIPAITISAPALRGMVSLRGQFSREHLYPSDRRWRASVKILKAAAFLDGRTEVIEDDLAVLRYTLWDTVQQIDKVHRLCMIAANPFVERLLEIKDAVGEVDAAITMRTLPDAAGNDQSQARTTYGKEANSKLRKVRDQLDALLMESEGRAIPGFKVASDEHRRVLKRVFTVCIGQTDEEAEIMMRDRLGSGDGGNL